MSEHSSDMCSAVATELTLALDVVSIILGFIPWCAQVCM